MATIQIETGQGQVEELSVETVVADILLDGIESLGADFDSRGRLTRVGGISPVDLVADQLSDRDCELGLDEIRKLIPKAVQALRDAGAL